MPSEGGLPDAQLLALRETDPPDSIERIPGHERSSVILRGGHGYLGSSRPYSDGVVGSRRTPSRARQTRKLRNKTFRRLSAHVLTSKKTFINRKTRA